jgi:hypothetical protein
MNHNNHANSPLPSSNTLFVPLSHTAESTSSSTSSPASSLSISLQDFEKVKAMSELALRRTVQHSEFLNTDTFQHRMR